MRRHLVLTFVTFESFGISRTLPMSYSLVSLVRYKFSCKQTIVATNTTSQIQLKLFAGVILLVLLAESMKIVRDKCRLTQLTILTCIDWDSQVLLRLLPRRLPNRLPLPRPTNLSTHRHPPR